MPIISPTITVQTTPDYSAGDSVGGKITLGNVQRANKDIVLQNVIIRDTANIKPTGNILIFSGDPTAATITDNAAFVFSTDITKLIARIPVATADYVTIDSIASADIDGKGRVLQNADSLSDDLYMVFVADATLNFSATTNLSISFGILQG
jgi:hypothetical protein